MAMMTYATTSAPTAGANQVDSITAEEITATALETVSLAQIPLPVTSPPYPPPPKSWSLSPPSNIPLPHPITQGASHLQNSLRILAANLYNSMQPPHTHLLQILRALHPIALASSTLSHHLAHLNVVPLLLTAAVPPLNQPFLSVNVLGPLLRDPFARSRFASAEGPYHLLRILQQFASEYPPSPIVSPICAILADAFPHLPPLSTDALRTPVAFETFRLIIHHALTAEKVGIIRPTLRLLNGVLSLHPSATQPIARDKHLIQISITAIHSMPELTCPALRFLYAAISNNSENIALYGSVQSALGVDLVLRACRGPALQPDFLILISALLDTLSQNQRNFRRMTLLGLTDTLVDLLPRLPPVTQPSTISLLARCLNSPSSSAGPYVGPAADAIFHCLTVCSSHPQVQNAGILALVVINDACSVPIPSSIPSRSVEAAHFAMTEHASNPRVLEACARLFLALPAAEIAASACSLPDLVNLLRARFRAHFADVQASGALLETIQALEYVIKHTNMSHGCVSGKVQASIDGEPAHPTNPVIRKFSICASGNLRMAWNRRSRSGSTRHLDEAPKLRTERRVRSDFGMDYSPKHNGEYDSGPCRTGETRGTGRNVLALKKVRKMDIGTAEYLRSKLKRKVKISPLPPCDPDAEMRVAKAAAMLMSEPLSQALLLLKEEPLEPKSFQESSPSASRPPPAPRYSPKAQVMNAAWVETSLNSSTADGIRHDDANDTVEPPSDVAFPSNVSTTHCQNNLNMDFAMKENASISTIDGSIITSVAKSGNHGTNDLLKTVHRENHGPALNSYLPGVLDDEFDFEDSGLSISDSASGSTNDAWASHEGLGPTFRYEVMDDELYGSGVNSSQDGRSTIDDGEFEEASFGKGGDSESNDEDSISESSGSSSDHSTAAVQGSRLYDEEQDPHSRSFSSLGNPSGSREFDGPLSAGRGGDPYDLDVLVQSRRFGERERRPGTDGVRSSNSWNRPNWSIWSISSGADQGTEPRSYPNSNFHPRVETGSLRLRR